MEWWHVATAANFLVFVAYMGISYCVLKPLAGSRQLWENKLGLATGVIFFSCGIGHALHFAHLIEPALGADAVNGLAARRAMDWHIALWDMGTGLVGLWYWTLRKTYGNLMRGAALFEDLKDRQRRALEINDNIVQGLTVAKMALDLHEHDRSREALDASLMSARGIISELLGESNKHVLMGAGDLRRKKAAELEFGKAPTLR